MKATNVVILSLVLGAAAFAEQTNKLEQAIYCRGNQVNVYGSSKNNTLSITHLGQQGFKETPLPIVRVIPMFPVFSVSARKDQRPVDGVLVEADLSIQTETVPIHGGGMPARLVVRTANLMGNTSVYTYTDLACTIQR